MLIDLLGGQIASAGVTQQERLLYSERRSRSDLSCLLSASIRGYSVV